MYFSQYVRFYCNLESVHSSKLSTVILISFYAGVKLIYIGSYEQKSDWTVKLNTFPEVKTLNTDSLPEV